MSADIPKMPRRVALYQHADGGGFTVFEGLSKDREPQYTGYIRISEWVEVTFPLRDRGDVTAAAVASLDAERERVVDKFSKELARIDGRKAELLAITHQVTV